MIRSGCTENGLERISRKISAVQVCIVVGLILFVGLAGMVSPGSAGSRPDDFDLMNKLPLGIDLNHAMAIIVHDPSARIVKNSNSGNGEGVVFKVNWLGYLDLNALMVFSPSNCLEALYVVLPKREHMCLSMPELTVDIRTLMAAVEEKYKAYDANLATPLWNPDDAESTLSCHDLPSRGLRDLLSWYPSGSSPENITIGGMIWNRGPSSRNRFSAYLKITGSAEFRNEVSLAERLSENGLDLALDSNTSSR